MEPQRSTAAGAGPSSSAENNLDHLLRAAQLLGVSLEELFQLSASKQTKQVPAPLPTYHGQSGDISGVGEALASFHDNDFFFPDHAIEESSDFEVLQPNLEDFTGAGMQSDPMSGDFASILQDLPAMQNLPDMQNIDHFQSYPEALWGWHSCDESYDSFLNRHDTSNIDVSRRPSPQVPDDREWVQLTPQSSGDSAESHGSDENLSRESTVSDNTWELLHSQGLSSNDEAQRSGRSSSSYSKTLHLLAPKVPNQDPLEDRFVTHESSLQAIDNMLLGMTEHKAGKLTSPTDVGKKRKKRSRYIDIRTRTETGLTRQMNACVRCRIQRNRCIPDPTNPTGPCRPCQEKVARMTRLPCLRYKITDSILFRTGLDYMPFYKRHPMVGPTYGDFGISKEWAGTTTRLLDITQGRGSVPLTLEVREFRPPCEENALDLKGRSMYYIPWAIADAEHAVRAVNMFVDANAHSYLDTLIDKTNPFIWDVFQAAMTLAIHPKPNKLLQNVLRLWVVCRFVESGWRCCGSDTLDAETLKDPFYDWISPPPYIDYQFASVVMHRVLEPLRLKVLRDLQTLVLANKSRNWYQVFLVCFILLHNYELQVLFQRQFANRRKASVRYLDMPLVRATHSGAKTILAHFHYGCKGQRPFRDDFDWTAPQTRKMAQLEHDQMKFMERYKPQVVENASQLRAVNRTDVYEDKYWFVSQLFEDEWRPRETYEHAPAIQQ